MRGRLAIAAAALTMALTPGVASATQDGDDQTTGSYSAEATMPQHSEGTEFHSSEAPASHDSGTTTASQSSETPASHNSGATASHSSEAPASYSSEAPGSHEAPRADEGVPGYEVVTLPNENVPNFQRRTVYCPPGKKVIGGGAEARGNTAILVGSFPTDDARGWIGLGRQTSADNVGISVFAICANV